MTAATLTAHLHQATWLFPIIRISIHLGRKRKS